MCISGYIIQYSTENIPNSKRSRIQTMVVYNLEFSLYKGILWFTSNLNQIRIHTQAKGLKEKRENTLLNLNQEYVHIYHNLKLRSNYIVLRGKNWALRKYPFYPYPSFIHFTTILWEEGCLKLHVHVYLAKRQTTWSFSNITAILLAVFANIFWRETLCSSGKCVYTFCSNLTLIE